MATFEMSSNSFCHLILGGARSGKSRFGEAQAAERVDAHHVNVSYLATAKAYDDEMRSRIEQHQLDRPIDWNTVEVPLALGEAITKASRLSHVVLVDCLTLWMMNALDDERPLSQHVDKLLGAIEKCQTPIVLVSNEISMGVVPMGELSRQFVDELGRLHQRIAQVANKVTLMVAGIPHPIKS